MFSALALALAPPLVAAGQSETVRDNRDGRRIVILNSADSHLPAFIALDRGLREAIAADSKVPTSFYAEALDMYRFPQAKIEQDIVGLLNKKYRGVKVDAIVAAGDASLRFAQQYGEDIWPGAPIVFHSVPESTLDAHSLAPGTIGIPVKLEFSRTLDLALTLRPDARRVIVLAGGAEADRRIQAIARASLAAYEGRLEIQYLAGLKVNDMIDAVRALPADAVVLFSTVFRDGSGAPLVPRDVLQSLAAASKAPIFGVFETYVGHGILAGAITSYESQGRRAGKLVVRILNGEAPSTLGIQASLTSGCIADARQLRRWHVSESLLPADCEIRFKELTAWDRYHWQILATLAVVLLQSGLIVALLLNRRRLRSARNKVRAELGLRAKAEALAAGLQSQLARLGRERSMGAVATAIAHEVNQPLIAIQNYAQAAKRRLQEGSEGRSKLVELFAKIEGQAERAGTITQRIRNLVSHSDLAIAPAALPPIAEEVVRLMQSEAQSAGCDIELAVAQRLPDVLADPLALQLVLVNLVRNAIESVSTGASDEKRVSIDVQQTDDQEVRVSVADTGPGVAPEYAAEIFEPLYSGKGDGLGVGLAISRTIIEGHGGRLWYEPNPAGGAIFRFALRVAGHEHD
jgi:signal transduction histidine kinase